jgi:RNA polymerase sigma-70 factor (ECF subfamily)
MRDKRDQQRFTALLREHQRIVMKVAGAYARTTHDRDDLAQDIAVQLWRSFGTFDETRSKFTTWMYRVALNVAISGVRSMSRQGAAHVVPLDDSHVAAVASKDDAHHEAMERDERVAALHAFVARLDPLNRALVLLYLEDRSYAEIADVLGISETNVATKLGRIRQKLRGQAFAMDNEGASHGTR